MLPSLRSTPQKAKLVVDMQILDICAGLVIQMPRGKRSNPNTMHITRKLKP